MHSKRGFLYSKWWILQVLEGKSMIFIKKLSTVRFVHKQWWFFNRDWWFLPWKWWLFNRKWWFFRWKCWFVWQIEKLNAKKEKMMEEIVLIMQAKINMTSITLRWWRQFYIKMMNSSKEKWCFLDDSSIENADSSVEKCWFFCRARSSTGMYTIIEHDMERGEPTSED